jgi:hypothetical protein
MRQSFRTRLVLLPLAISALSSSALAISSDQPAAIVTFPQIVVDSAGGVDTFLQITNRDSSADVDVKCFLENANRHCDDNGSICQDDADCLPSFCREDFAVDEFTIRLTARQPFGWQASAGATGLPLPQNQGSIPAVAEDPFRGTLRCVAVDTNGAPVDRNVLKGTATIERFESGAQVELDAARYNAIGFQAIPGANNGDNELFLGGPQAEYESCPATVRINHFFDAAIEPMTHSSQVFTDLIVVPCSRDLFRQEAGGSVAQFIVYNEFEQRFSISRVVSVRLDGQLSLIDTINTERSIFSAGVAGTLSGQTLMSPPGQGAGVLAVAVERHERLGVPGGTVASAAFNLHSQGELSGGDLLLVGKPPLCRSAPLSGCRTARSTSLFFREKSRREKLAWNFRKGQATSTEEFGNPASSTDFGLCIYVGNPATLYSAEIPASATKWAALSNGQRYEDRTASEGGIERITLRASTRDRSRVMVDGRGDNLDLPGLPLQLPVKVQLANSETGVCWEAEYGPEDVVNNVAERFRARK